MAEEMRGSAAALALILAWFRVVNIPSAEAIYIVFARQGARTRPRRDERMLREEEESTYLFRCLVRRSSLQEIIAAAVHPE